jgi:hypothetical protein
MRSRGHPPLPNEPHSLLGHLLFRSDDWKGQVNDLQRRGDLGRDALQNVLERLRKIFSAGNPAAMGSLEMLIAV